MTSSNCLYRVGDYVYFDVAHSTPYSIRRIEELIKNQSGNIEAKVLCFFRRRDISSSLISLADKHNIALEEEQELEAESLNEKQKHQLKHRELFFSRQIETLPATHIRGKCNVSLLNETESLSSYLNKEDSFFYTLVYEPNQKTLLADRGEIRVGQRYQAEIQKQLEQPTEDLNIAKKWETLIFKPNDLSSDEIERYITIVKSIGTFGRALDVSSTIKQSNLLLTASNASRDITIQKAMDILHENDYDIGKALLAFTPNNVPTICKDELEEWSPSEAALFEESLEKYGKSFNEIRREVLPWKRMKNIIEYYYMWKTTDRHVNPKRLKANDSETKLKQVYIPNNKQQMNNGIANGAISGDVPGKSCESCGKVNSTLWYSWGTAHSNDRLCQSCWTYWKKFGGLRYPNKLTVQEQEKLNSSSNTSLNNSTGNGSNGQNLNNSTKDSNKTNTNNLNNNSTNDEQYKCKECNKSFNRQGNAHEVLNLMVKNKRNDEVMILLIYAIIVCRAKSNV